MASYLGISRVRVYQLIKAGLPLTSYEEAQAWRLGRRPGHPKKMALEFESNTYNPIPSISAAAPDNAGSHTDSQFLSLNPIIKSVVQCCTPTDLNWQSMSSTFCSFDSMLLQLGASMQKVFSIDAKGTLPVASRCGELAARLQLVQKSNEEYVAAKKRAEKKVAAEKRAVDDQKSQFSVNERTPVRSRPAPVPKSAEKTPRKPVKRVEVVVEVPSEDEEHIDGVTSWIGALMHARHVLPGRGASDAGRVYGHDREIWNANEVDRVKDICLRRDRDAIDESRHLIEETRVQIKCLEEEMASQLRKTKSGNRNGSAMLAIEHHLAQRVQRLAELEQEFAHDEGIFQESLDLAHIPLDTRSQFIVEVRIFACVLRFVGFTRSQARSLCQKDLR